MAHDIDVGILVEVGEKGGGVSLEYFEDMVDQGLRRVFAVDFRVFEGESVSVCLNDVVCSDSKVISLAIWDRCLAVSNCRDELLLSLVTVTPEVSYPSCSWQDLSGQAESENAHIEHFENVVEAIECTNR